MENNSWVPVHRIPPDYLFYEHSEETIRRWAKSMRYFRFFRAFGGHANDGDSLDVAISYNDIEDLKRVLKILGVQWVEYDEQPQQPEIGKSCSQEEFSRFPWLIPGSRWIKQPGRQQIGGVQLSLWCYEGKMQISAAVPAVNKQTGVSTI